MVYGVLDSLMSERKIDKVEGGAILLLDVDCSLPVREGETNTMSKPSLNLEMIGVPLGAILTYNDDEEISWVVTKLSPPEVVLDGKNCSLYEATCVVINTSFYSGSSYYWKFDGETLHDRRKRFEAYHRSR